MKNIFKLLSSSVFLSWTGIQCMLAGAGLSPPDPISGLDNHIPERFAIIIFLSIFTPGNKTNL